jgi:TPR repeat protein
MSFIKIFFLIGMFACPIFTASVLTAQAAEVDTSAMSLNEVYRYAEDLRQGRGIERDLDRALVLHQQLALDGKEISYARISFILLTQGRLAEAKTALEAGRDLGSSVARRELAIGHVKQRFGALSDPEFGVSELVEVTQSSNNTTARYELARAYEAGTGTDIQLEKAREIYEELAAEGHGRSLRSLGDLAREGAFSEPDFSAATNYYRAAAATGYNYAWITLARLHADLGEYQDAIGSYNSAIAAGVARANVEFAKRHFLGDFGTLSDRAYGSNLLQTLSEAGDVDAASEALELWERRSRRIGSLDLEGVISMLDEAMRMGNETATVALARAYRVLNWRIPQARERHAEIVQEFSDQLGRRRFREYFYASYDRNNHWQSRQTAYDLISPLEGEEFYQAVRALRTTEMTAFVYLLQQELRKLGYYSGSPTASFNHTTLNATMQFCQAQGIAEICIHGPLRWAASKDIILQLTEVRSEG